MIGGLILGQAFFQAAIQDNTSGEYTAPPNLGNLMFLHSRKRKKLKGR